MIPVEQWPFCVSFSRPQRKVPILFGDDELQNDTGFLSDAFTNLLRLGKPPLSHIHALRNLGNEIAFDSSWCFSFLFTYIVVSI